MAEANDGLVSALARVAQGDRQAFAGFYQQTHRAVFGMCLHLLRDKDEACDVYRKPIFRSGITLESITAIEAAYSTG